MQLIFFFVFSVNFFYQIMYQANKKDIYITTNTINTEKNVQYHHKEKQKILIVV